MKLMARLNNLLFTKKESTVNTTSKKKISIKKQMAIDNAKWNRDKNATDEGTDTERTDRKVNRNDERRKKRAGREYPKAKKAEFTDRTKVKIIYK